MLSILHQAQSIAKLTESVMWDMKHRKDVVVHGNELYFQMV
jgi:hypothetical protein